MKFLYLVHSRIRLYWKDNGAFFLLIASVSVFVVLLLIVAYEVSVPSVAARHSDDEDLRTITIEFYDGDGYDVFQKVLEKSGEYGTVSKIEVQSFPKDRFRIVAVHSTIAYDDNAYYVGRSFFTESEEESQAMVAIAKKNHNGSIGDVIETPFGKFTIVGKDTTNTGNLVIPFNTFFCVQQIPAVVKISFADQMSIETENIMITALNEMLPKHFIGASSIRYLEAESAGIIKTMGIVTLLSFLVLMSALDYLDLQNSSNDALMRLTGGSKVSVVILSSVCRVLFLVGSSIVAFALYDLMVTLGVSEIPLFGKLFRLSISDRMIVTGVIVGVALLSVLPYAIKNYLTTPKGIAQKRE